MVAPPGGAPAQESESRLGGGLGRAGRNSSPARRSRIVRPAGLPPPMCRHHRRRARGWRRRAAFARGPRGLEGPRCRAGRISAVDHGHREAEPICRGPQEAGEVLQGLDAENVSLRADGPADRECVQPMLAPTSTATVPARRAVAARGSPAHRARRSRSLSARTVCGVARTRARPPSCS